MCGLSSPVAEDILRLQLFDKLKNSTILAHDLAWFRRAEAPANPEHLTVFTHDWLLNVIRSKIKSQELDLNARSVMTSLANNSSPLPGLGAGVEDPTVPDDTSDTTEGRGNGRGKGKHATNAATPPADAKAVPQHRLDTLKANEAAIKAQKLCLEYNRTGGHCLQADCIYTHRYFSINSLNLSLIHI